MSKINAGQAPSTLIPEYIGSAFDAVLTCADNISDVKTVSENINDVVTVVDNILNVNKVATDVGDVVTVADNIDYVKDVAEGIEGLPVSGYIGDTPPTQPKVGATWYCTLDGRNYTWYGDVDSGQWVESSPQSTADDPHLAGNIFTLWKRSAAEAGYNLVAGSFEEGGVLTSSTDVLWHKGLDSIYSWVGTYPINGYVVPPNTNPVGNANYVSRTDVVLRGELAGIAGAALIGGATYAQIRSYSGAESRIYCLGRDNVFDQAYGMFVLDAIDTASADNDGTILVDALGRRWKRQHDGAVSIRWFGGDNTGVTLCNSALDKAKTTWAEVHFPKGTYRIEGYDLSDMSLSGEYDRGLNEAEVNYRTKIVGSGDIFTNANNFTIDGFYFKNVGSLGKIISVADMDTQIGIISNCYFYTANYHIFHQSASHTIVGSSIQNCKFRDAKICSRWYDNQGLYQYSEEQCYTQANAIGIMFRSASAATFSDSVFEFNTDVAVKIENTVSFTAAVRGVSFRNVHFEHNHLGSPGPHVRINVTNGHAVVEFSGGGFYISEAPENCIDTSGSGNLNLLIAQTHAATANMSNGTKLIELGVATTGRNYGLNVSNCHAEFDVVAVRNQGVAGLLNTTGTIYAAETATPILAADPLSAKLVLVSDMTTRGAALLVLTDTTVSVLHSTLTLVQWSIVSGTLHGRTTGGSSFRSMAFLQLSC